jgi:hypothetical protein
MELEVTAISERVRLGFQFGIRRKAVASGSYRQLAAAQNFKSMIGRVPAVSFDAWSL